MNFLIRLAVTAAALWAAVAIVPGIDYAGHWAGLLGVAFIFGLVNALIRPLILMLTCPLVVLTLGIFVLVLNALMLWLTSSFSSALGLTFTVDGFLAAFLGAIVVSLVSTLLSLLVGDKKEKD